MKKLILFGLALNVINGSDRPTSPQKRVLSTDEEHYDASTRLEQTIKALEAEFKKPTPQDPVYPILQHLKRTKLALKAIKPSDYSALPDKSMTEEIIDKALRMYKNRQAELETVLLAKKEEHEDFIGLYPQFTLTPEYKVYQSGLNQEIDALKQEILNLQDEINKLDPSEEKAPIVAIKFTT